MSVKAAFLVPHPPLIIPEIGRGEEQKINDTINAYNYFAREIAEIKPDLIIIMSPHARAFADFIEIYGGQSLSGTMAKFGAANLSVTARCDAEFAAELDALAQSEGIPAGIIDKEKNMGLDHAALIPLYFINRFYDKENYKLMLCGISGLSPQTHYKFGELIARAVENENKKAVYIASGDLSHKLKSEGPYGFDPAGPTFDKKIAAIIERGDTEEFLNLDDTLCESAAHCGLKPLQTLAGVLSDSRIEKRLLSYEGPFGVGYAVAEFKVVGGN